MQSCIWVEVLFILKLKYTILYINERVFLECWMDLNGVETSTYSFMERYSTSIYDYEKTIEISQMQFVLGKTLNDFDT
jgi:hypothetical protein